MHPPAALVSDYLWSPMIAIGDRLRAVNCQSEMIDQVVEWSERSVGENYREGFEVSLVNHLIMQI